jgi:hypothetical protein
VTSASCKKKAGILVPALYITKWLRGSDLN